MPAILPLSRLLSKISLLFYWHGLVTGRSA